MKTLGRILILSFVFVLLAGLMVVAVNVSGMNAPDFGGNRSEHTELRPPESNGQPFLNREELGGLTGARWIFGMVKNIGVIAILVIAIVWPKSVVRKKRRLPR